MTTRQFWIQMGLLFIATLLYIAFIGAATMPTITHDSRTDRFLVSFPEGGYTWTCTEFKSLKETIVQEGKTVPYTPRDCGPLAGGEKQTSYVQPWGFVVKNGGEWEVRAILQKDDTSEYPTNTVTVIH